MIINSITDKSKKQLEVAERRKEPQTTCMRVIMMVTKVVTNRATKVIINRATNRATNRAINRATKEINDRITKKITNRAIKEITNRVTKVGVIKAIKTK